MIRLLKDPTTPQQQEDFAAFMRARLPKPKGEPDHQLYAFTTYASKVLKRRLLHWRGLTADELRQVMVAVTREYPWSTK